MDRNVREIVEFLQLEHIDIDRVVAGSRFDSKDEHFKTKYDIDHKDAVF